MNNVISQKSTSKKVGHNLRTLRNNAARTINTEQSKKIKVEDKDIIKLYRDGYDLSQIKKKFNLSADMISYVLIKNGFIEPDAITVDKLYKFRDNDVKIGDVYKITIEIPRDDYRHKKIIKVHTLVKVLKKYPHIVQTDKGYFKYIDLYIGENIK